MPEERGINADICIRCGDITCTLNFDEAVKTVLDAVENCLEIQAAAVYLLDPSGERLTVAGVSNLSPEYARREPITVSETPSVREILEGKIAAVPDADSDPIHKDWAGIEGIRSLLAAPLKARERPIGILWVFSSRRRDFSIGERNILATLASQGGITLWNSKMHRDVHRIADVGKAVTSRLDLNAILNRVLESAVEIFGGKASSVYLVNPEKDHLELSAYHGLENGFFESEILPLSEPVRECLRKTIVVSDPSAVIDHTFSERLEEHRFRSVLCTPLRVREKAVGILRVFLQHVASFSENDRLLFQILADFGGIAIENARLYNHIKRDYEDLTRDVWHWYDWGKKSPKI